MPEEPVSLFADFFDAEELALELKAESIPLPPEDRPPWERQRGESGRAYHAFMHFRAQPPNFHSNREAYRDHVRECVKDTHLDASLIHESPKHWRVWSSQWGWMERVAAWDAEVDRRARAKLMDAQVAARERHVQTSQHLQYVLTLPVKAAIEASKDPQFMKKMVKAARTSGTGAHELIRQVARMADALPAVVNMERLALGLSTDAIAHGLGPIPPGNEAALADVIPTDPVSTDLAIALLDRISRVGPRAALGTGTPSQPGELADSPTPELVDEETG